MKKIYSSLCPLIAIIFVLLTEGIFTNVHSATYTVTNTGDNSGVDPLPGLVTGTLRQAIINANFNPGADIIRFNIGGPGVQVQTINLSSLLPIITGPTDINGYTQPGATQGPIGSRTILIEINGNSAAGRDGLFRFTSLVANNSSLSGIAIYNTGSSVEAVMIEPGSDNIHIWGNYIGLLANGTNPPAGSQNKDDGILLGHTSAVVKAGFFSNITIGTNGDGINDASEGNVISNAADATNGGDGIQIGSNFVTAYTWSNIKISGNYIGIAADGTTVAANGRTVIATADFYGQDGINIKGATNILIGSNADGISDILERNIISGNTGNGIELNNSVFVTPINSISIAGNFIGTDKTGTVAVPNGIKSDALNPFLGILVKGATVSNVVIGFDDSKHPVANAAAARNVISGNQHAGVQFFQATGTGNRISGNYIGVNVTGNTALGNGQFNKSHPATVLSAAGIDVNASNNIIIGTNANGTGDIEERNVISGNIDARGVYIRNSSVANVVAGNYIGVGADGTTGVGNDFTGVYIDGSNNNRVGSNDDGINDAVEGNTIANNAKSINAANQSTDGVRITNNASIAAAATQNRISRNRFYSNKANPIDLANDGVSVNDGVTTASQPNLLLDYPVFTFHNITGTTLTVSGYVGQCNGTEPLAGTTIAGSLIVQVYKVADDGDQNGSITGNGCSRSVAHGEGIQYLGSISVSAGVFTNASFTLASGATFAASDKLTGITIDINGNTSEFGVNVAPDQTALPVTLENFTGTAKDCNTVSLNWKVSDAINFNRFEIERSTNGIDFKTMGSVAYNASVTNYNFSETVFEKGSYQYRLKMIDTDGKSKYSSIAFIRLDCNQQRTLLVYPNPSKDKVTINGLKGGEKVTMYNAQGQLVYTKTSTDYQLNINMALYKSGMYYIIVKDKNGEKINESKIAKIDR